MGYNPTSFPNDAFLSQRIFPTRLPIQRTLSCTDCSRQRDESSTATVGGRSPVGSTARCAGSSRVYSRSEIGSVVISPFHGTPLGSGVINQTPPPAPDNFSQPLRTLVVDDSFRFLKALCAYLQTQPLFVVVGTAMGGAEALHMAEVLPEKAYRSRCRLHDPRKCGARFSKNAATPSRKSSLP